MRTHPGLTLLYVGYLEHMRGLEVVIRSLPMLIAKGINPLLMVVGDGEHRSGLEKLASSLGVESNLCFAGWVDQSYLPTIIAASDICLVPHYVTTHTDTTIPNKIFDYMAQAKPVVVSHAAALREIVEEYGCGVSYTDKSPAELAQKLLHLTDTTLRRKMGESGLKAVQQIFNWDVDRRALLKAVGCTAN
jgi:glycosyltransferase involved in cell wall biosynthesis